MLINTATNVDTTSNKPEAPLTVATISLTCYWLSRLQAMGVRGRKIEAVV